MKPQHKWMERLRDGEKREEGTMTLGPTGMGGCRGARGTEGGGEGNLVSTFL